MCKNDNRVISDARLDNAEHESNTERELAITERSAEHERNTERELVITERSAERELTTAEHERNTERELAITERSALSADELNIAGFSKLSTVDWPGKLGATLFLQGCPLRCNYCHNYEILDPSKKGGVSWGEVMKHLEKRVGLLDAVIFSGGEPLMQKALIPALKKARSMGYLTGLHTSGIYPAMFKKALEHLDWVGFDIKATWGKYDKIVNVKNSATPVKKSLEMLVASGVDYQTRTTFDKTVLTEEDKVNIDNMLAEYGVTNNEIQTVRLIGAPETYKTNARA
jgi:pyruvate formate lyase activating enzyme